MGGIQIKWQDHNGDYQACTLGPMVSKGNELDSERGYLTNSHCSSDPYDTDGDSHWQNLYTYPSHIIGNETLDPPRMTGTIQYVMDGDTVQVDCGGGGFHPIDGCRWSDAAYTAFAPNNSSRVHGHALVAEPKSQNTGSIQLDPNSMGFQVGGELSNPIEGETVDKVGKETGWTDGVVKHACKDVLRYNKVTDEYTMLLCQDQADYMEEQGDSGAPVFVDVYGTGGNIKIIGIHNGFGPDYATFSAVANIEEDLGLDLHFGPWFY